MKHPKDCDCCTGLEPLTPLATANRPGLSQLTYRVGTHATFLETMKARLGRTFVERPSDQIADWLLKSEQIRHMAQFVRRLQKANDAFTRHLRTQFTTEVADQLTAHDSSQPPGEELQTALLDDLNRILATEQLYAPERTRHLDLSTTIQSLLAQESLSGDDFTRLNRLLLEAAYPDLIVPRQRLYPLHGLTTRSEDDPAIAMLDAWATVADVLTFYQERIANEGYLPTATERRSILELARLVGYKLRPGVAATVYLAFTMEKGYVGEIPVGTRGQSIPNPGETAQFFETEEALPARAEWNEMKPRLQRPLNFRYYNQADDFPYLYFQGIDLNLKPGDPLLFVENDNANTAVSHFIETVEIQAEQNRTKVKLQGAPKEAVVAFQEALFVIIGYYQDLSLHGVSDTTQMAQRVLEILEKLKIEIASDSTTGKPPAGDDLLTAVNNVLPELREEQAIAQEGQYTKLEPWVSGLIVDLEEAVSRYSVSVSNTAYDYGNDDYYDGYPPYDGEEQRIELASLSKLGNVLEAIAKAPSQQPANARKLRREVAEVLAADKEIVPKLLKNLQPGTAEHLYKAWSDLTITKPTNLSVYALRVKAAPFGHNVPQELISVDDNGVPRYEEWDLWEFQNETRVFRESPQVVWLDNVYETVQPESWIVLNRPAAAQTIPPDKLVITKVTATSLQVRAEYGIVGKSTRLEINDVWLDLDSSDDDNTDEFSVIRGTAVYAQSEQLTLTDAPVTEAVGFQEFNPEAGKRIELDGLYDGLEAGRWLVVSGEREDVESEGEKVEGLHSSELVMLAGVEQGWDDSIPGEKPHTTLILANNLAYRYKRDTVKINANVAKSSHGETIEEVLGSGKGSLSFQTFTLKRPPLTHLSAPTAVGTESTLSVFINDVRWHEADNLAFLNPADRNFITQRDNEENTHIIFGNGQRGARLPSGVENVRAVYRSGIGRSGNVQAEQISLLATKPLGVKGVINPIAAAGGTDPENVTQARRNTPLPLMALDRIVSVADYADFARSFAGIGKAQAARLSDGQRQVVMISIAGEKDTPIDKRSDLYRNLLQAVHQIGDPYQAVQIEPRELMLVVINASIRIHPDYLWEVVEPQIRQTLLDVFGFERRALGQDVLLSEVMSVIQQVTGVVYVDVDAFGAIPEKRAAPDGSRVPLSPNDIANKANEIIEKSKKTGQMGSRIPVNLADVEQGGLRPAQLAYLSPDIPDTLILMEKS